MLHSVCHVPLLIMQTMGVFGSLLLFVFQMNINFNGQHSGPDISGGVSFASYPKQSVVVPIHVYNPLS